MKVETKMNKILINPKLSKGLKVIKLENLALSCVANSPIQAEITKNYTTLKNEVLKENPDYFSDLFNKCFRKGA